MNLDSCLNRLGSVKTSTLFLKILSGLVGYILFIQNNGITNTVFKNIECGLSIKDANSKYFEEINYLIDSSGL